MALEGDIGTFPVPDLLQLLHQLGKEGILEIEGKDGRARLFFKDGNLIHAQMNKDEGEKVVADLMFMESGRFKFLAEKPPAKVTISKDIPTLIVYAAAVKDEKKGLLSKRPQETIPEKVSKVIDSLFAVNREILTAFIIDGDGRAIGSKAAREGQERLKELASFVFETHPYLNRGPLERFLIKDRDGLLLVDVLSSKHLLIVSAGADAMLGRLFRDVERLTPALKEVFEA